MVKPWAVGSTSKNAVKQISNEFARLASAAEQLRKPLHSPIMLSAVAEDLTLDDALEEVVRLCGLRLEDDWPLAKLSPEVPRLLRHVFNKDFERVMSIERTVENVTCMQPAAGSSVSSEGIKWPLQQGRRCEGGDCCEACSRVSVQSIATPEECEEFLEALKDIAEPSQVLQHIEMCEVAETRNIRATLLYVRWIERMRRLVAHEYGLKLSRVAPFNCILTSRRPGGQDAIHCDEEEFANVHYSGVLYLGTQGMDFEGGAFTLVEKEADGLATKKLVPEKGKAILFSGGWENIHFVEPVSRGLRWCIPMFFTTAGEEPSDDHADDSAIAAKLWSNLISEDAVDYFNFQQQWHYWVAGA